MSVYSTQFLRARGADISVSYTVPAGLVAVVRDISGYIAASSSATEVLVYGGSENVIWLIALGAALDSAFHWNGRQVFVASESFTVVSGAGIDVAAGVSGYLLSS